MIFLVVSQVSLTFTSLKELPGAQTSLVLKAKPGSLCSVQAIDQSVLLLKPEKKLSVESVRSEHNKTREPKICSWRSITS